MDFPRTPAADWSQDLPRSVWRHVLFGLILLAVSFGGFGAWAFRAPLAAAVLAAGSFVATGRNKIVQHLEGGIIAEIRVNEGDQVQAGQPLLLLDQTSALANKRELMLRRVRLETIAARLQAVYAGTESVNLSDYVAQLRGDPEIDAMVEEQLVNFVGSRAKFDSDIALLTSNIHAAQARREGLEEQLTALERQVVLLEEDHDARTQLMERGLVRRSEVNALRRALAEADGEAARLRSMIRETTELTQKAQLQITQARNEDRQQALDEMQVVESELDSIREQSLKAQDILERSEILSPVAGTVVRLHYHTIGGVIEAGKPIIEILPDDVPLIIEAQVPRTDVDSLTVGHPASVRLTSLNQRTTPVLIGRLIYVSADAIPSDTDGARREVYLARVDIAADELSRVHGFTPTPGMPAEVMIQTESRTFMQYLLKPVRDSFSRAFLEN
ncbi:HlyD family type I secretion periplasmic adaptor subunit [Paracoccus sp. T5]|uniref:HlyD family type I secretion periplasmic adaptor subunit n=1 Tax=Paracoccus sp. T5 TaxID=3402161 RepID=UPI003AE4B5EB